MTTVHVHLDSTEGTGPGLPGPLADSAPVSGWRAVGRHGVSRDEQEQFAPALDRWTRTP